MATLRMITLGTVMDAIGEMIWMGESTCLDVIVKFAQAMVKVFAAEYLREPTVEGTKRLMASGVGRD